MMALGQETAMCGLHESRRAEMNTDTCHRQDDSVVDVGCHAHDPSHRVEDDRIDLKMRPIHAPWSRTFWSDTNLDRNASGERDSKRVKSRLAETVGGRPSRTISSPSPTNDPRSRRQRCRSGPNRSDKSPRAIERSDRFIHANDVRFYLVVADVTGLEAAEESRW